MPSLEFTPDPLPKDGPIPAAFVEQVARGDIGVLIVHSNQLTPVGYATRYAGKGYLKQRGIRVAYRNDYTAPRPGGGGNAYSYGRVILLAKGVQMPKGFKQAFPKK